MKETDYLDRIEVVERRLEVVKQHIILGDNEVAFDVLTKSSIDLNNIQKTMFEESKIRKKDLEET